MKLTRFNNPVVHILLLILVSLVLYIHTIDAGFMFDDYAQQFMLKLIENKEREVNIFNFVRTPGEVSALKELTAIPWWTPPEWRLKYFRPVATLSHLIDYTLWGSNPVPYHVQNVLWYTCLIILLYWFYKAFCVSGAMAFLGALTFALEPCHYLTVRWPAARNDIICATLLVASFLCYLGFFKKRDMRYGVLSLLAYLLSLLTKELAFLFPVLIVVHDWMRHKKLSEIVKNYWVMYCSFALINGTYLTFYVTNHYGSYWYGENLFRDYPFDFIKAASLYLGSLVFGYVIAGLPPHFPSHYWYLLVPQMIFIFYLGYLFWEQKVFYPEVPLFVLWIVILLPFIVIPPLNDRLLLIPTIGYAYLVALAISKMGKRWLAIFFIIFALCLPPFINLFQARGYDEAVQLNDKRLCQALDEIVPIKTAQDRLFFINFPSIGLAGENYMYLALYLNLLYHYPEWKVPVYPLSAFDSEVVVEVLDEHRLRIFHPTRFYFETNTEKLFSLNRTFFQGQVFELPEVRFTIDAMERGKVKSIVAEFSNPLDTPFYFFLFFDEGRWQRWYPQKRGNPFKQGVNLP